MINTRNIGLLFFLLAHVFLVGCHRASPLSGVWQSQDGGNPLTFEFRDNGSMRVDLVNNVVIPPVTTTVSGHYRVIDTNHICFEVENTYSTMTVTQGYALSNGEFSLQAEGENAWALGGSTNLKVRNFRQQTR